MTNSPLHEDPQSSNLSPERSKLVFDQLGRFLDLYKHHFDLFLKAVAGYLAVLGFLAGAINKPDTPPAERIVMSLLIALASIVAAAGSVISIKWVRTMKAAMGEMCDSLHIVAPSLSSAERIVQVMIALCCVFFVGGIGYALYARQTMINLSK